MAKGDSPDGTSKGYPTFNALREIGARYLFLLRLDAAATFPRLALPASWFPAVRALCAEACFAAALLAAFAALATANSDTSRTAICGCGASSDEPAIAIAILRRCATTSANVSTFPLLSGQPSCFGVR